MHATYMCIVCIMCTHTRTKGLHDHPPQHQGWGTVGTRCLCSSHSQHLLMVRCVLSTVIEALCIVHDPWSLSIHSVHQPCLGYMANASSLTRAHKSKDGVADRCGLDPSLCGTAFAAPPCPSTCFDVAQCSSTPGAVHLASRTTSGCCLMHSVEGSGLVIAPCEEKMGQKQQPCSVLCCSAAALGVQDDNVVRLFS